MSITLNNLQQQVETFSGITLVEMASIELLDRIDQKFVFHIHKLPVLLEELARHYRILEVDETRIQSYQTLYYDTPEMDMFYAHHNGLRYRQKIRIRTYKQSKKTFLEIKTKTNRNKTLKKRTSITILDLYPQKQPEFVKTNTSFSPEYLSSVLNSNFQRITFAGIDSKERLTLDLNLSYCHPDHENEWSNPRLCIAEIKTERSSTRSKAEYILKQNKIFPTGFSKYCFGICLLYPHLKQNRFKSYFLRLRKLQII